MNPSILCAVQQSHRMDSIVTMPSGSTPLFERTPLESPLRNLFSHLHRVVCLQSSLYCPLISLFPSSPSIFLCQPIDTMSAAVPLEVPPESTLPYPPLHTDAPFVVLSDW